MKESSGYFGRLGRPTIYAYTTPHYENRPWQGAKQGFGLLKVGYTERDVETRVKEQHPIKLPDAWSYKILVGEPAIDVNGAFFIDKAVHRLLDKKGFSNVGGEWYECTVEDVLNAIEELRQGRPLPTGRHQTFGLRPEQKDAVEKTKAYFDCHQNEPDSRARHFLWNAKMRFGKTFATYQLAKAMGWTKILVLTYKPAVEDAWRADLESHVDFEGWQFIGCGETFDAHDESRPLVWFASFQDILGRSKKGAVKDRFELAHVIDWDCVVLDEYHFGAWRESAKELLDSDGGERLDEYEDNIESVFPLTVKHFLYLSGTPFRALASGEFLEQQIFNWTYSDEQRSKETWDETKDGPNPYTELPRMVLLTYRMPDAIRSVALQGENNEFDLNEFFKAKKVVSSDGTESPRHVFEHETEVQMWLSLLRGQYLGDNPTVSASMSRPPVPFADVRLQQHLTHTFWFLPSVAACEAMAELLRKPQNAFFNDYKVLVVAGTKAGIGLNALPPVKEAMGDPLKTKTILLSCGKLTTGVSLPALSGIFMLRNTTSAESYFQAAFRVQTPWYVRNADGTDPHSKEIIKRDCYVFDFAPNRALRLISEYSSRLDLNDNSSVESRVAEFIRFLPVLCYDEGQMQELNAGQLLDYATAGLASSMLANRWQSPQLVNVDNFALEQLLNQPGLIEALEKIEAFRNLGRDLTTVINSERALAKLKRSEKEGKEVPKDEKAAAGDEMKRNANMKKQLREKLMKFVTRVPVFMYLTDYREEALKDVITNLDPELFTRVTGLRVSDFEKLCAIGVFNSSAMNSAIFAFKRFEEASLTYAGGRTLSEYVGGFDEVARRDQPLQAVEYSRAERSSASAE